MQSKARGEVSCIIVSLEREKVRVRGGEEEEVAF